MSASMWRRTTCWPGSTPRAAGRSRGRSSRAGRRRGDDAAGRSRLRPPEDTARQGLRHPGGLRPADSARTARRPAPSTPHKAQVATAKDSLSYTELRAGHPGMITARNIEVGQVAQAGETAFTLARTDRATRYSASMSPLSPTAQFARTSTLVSGQRSFGEDTGRVREVSPAVDMKTGTVQVKVEIDPTACRCRSARR